MKNKDMILLISKKQFCRFFIKIINKFEIYEKTVILLFFIGLKKKEIINLKLENITIIQNMGIISFGKYFKLVFMPNILIDIFLQTEKINYTSSLENQIKKINRKLKKICKEEFDFCIQLNSLNAKLFKIIEFNKSQEKLINEFILNNKKFNKIIKKENFSQLLKIRSLI